VFNPPLFRLVWADAVIISFKTSYQMTVNGLKDSLEHLSSFQKSTSSDKVINIYILSDLDRFLATIRNLV